MKKIYLKPVTDVHSIHVEKMLTSSPLRTTETSADSHYDSDARRRGGIFSEDVNDSRSNSIW